MTHEEYKQMLALEAVGALGEADGATALASHLETCAQCRAELNELREAAAMLAYTVVPVAPPAHLRERTLAAIKSGVAPRLDASAATNDGFAGTTGRNREPLPRAGLWQLLAQRPALGFGAVAGVVLICVLGIAAALLWKRTNELNAEVARLNARAQVAQEELARERAEVARGRAELVRAHEIEEVFTTPGAPMTLLAGTNAAPGARARLVLDRQSGRAVLIAHALPPAPAGKAYQLWYISGGKPLPGGVFTTDAQGHATLQDRMPAEGLGATLFAVTLEPEGGVSAPTGDKYLLGSAS